MRYGFNRGIDRHETNSHKYDFALQLGYSESGEEYFAAVAGWHERQFGWKAEAEWLVKTPGIAFAIAAAIRAFTKEGEAVLIQQPVYSPFSEVIKDNNRVVVNSPLILRDGHYEIDFADFEDKIITGQVKLFLLCSPHNPVGRVWQEEELRRIGEICLKHRVLVVSDEIRSDFVYSGHQHRVFSALTADLAEITITCTSPSKTFNLAGLQISNVFIANRDLKERFMAAIPDTGYSQINQKGLAACQAAYQTGAEWLDQLKEYLRGNLIFVREYLKKNLPEIKLIEPEGTDLLWLDFRSLQMTEAQRAQLLMKDAAIWSDSGAVFGSDGEGFEHINLACPRAVLHQSLIRLEKVVHN